MTFRFASSADVLAEQIAGALDPQGFRGWPRKSFVGVVKNHSFVIMKRDRRTLDLFYFACEGVISESNVGAIASVSFVASPVSAFVRYAWLPVVGLICVGTSGVVAWAAVSGKFEPVLLMQPVFPIVMLVVGMGLCAGVKSSHTVERQEIVTYLTSIGGQPHGTG